MSADRLPYDRPQMLTDNLRRVEGALPHFGMRRVMTVARRSDGDLVIHSAIWMDDADLRDLEAFGRPAYLLIPHKRHRMDAPKYKRRYPGLKIYAPPGAMAKAREVVAVDGTYDDVPCDPDVRLEILDGVRRSEGAMIVRSPDGVTVVLNEVVFDLTMPRNGLARGAIRLLGLGPRPRVTPLVRLDLVDDKRAVAAHLRRLAALEGLVRLVVSHDRMSSGAAAAGALEAAARSLE